MNKIKLIGHIMVATGKTVPQWAKSIGYTKTAVYAAINQTNRSPKIRAAICEATGLNEHEIWPEPNDKEAS